MEGSLQEAWKFPSIFRTGVQVMGGLDRLPGPSPPLWIQPTCLPMKPAFRGFQEEVVTGLSLPLSRAGQGGCLRTPRHPWAELGWLETRRADCGGAK